MASGLKIALIRGDGIGIDVADATIEVVNAACEICNAPALTYDEINAGAGYYAETGQDIEPGGEERAGTADAIFLGAIGLPSIRHEDGTEISPHLRLRDRFGLYAGIRPIKAYPNAPQRLADPRAATRTPRRPRESSRRYEKQEEFYAWLSEVKGVPMDQCGQRELKEHFSTYCEDYNTATFPDEKYYNLRTW